MDQLLATKLYIPPVRPEIVSRRRLIEKLNAGLHRKSTLVSAPAGFGKTTLIGEWLGTIQNNAGSTNRTDYRFAWLSLDNGDNDSIRFLSYFVAALSRVDEGETAIGKRALGMLQSTQSPPASSVLTVLINDLSAITGKVIFVLDDFHLIDSQSVHDALSFFIENMPPQVHLVLLTREDPLLPIPRLRARGQLTELRAADLRFTSSEVADFLNRVMGLNLTRDDIATLETRTEGWIAGLQLAAISLQGRPDATQLIKTFSGSHRLVLDYLIEEVLNQQPESVRTFLLQTAILDRLTGSLCDALTGQNNGQKTLEMLGRSNLFIVPMDNEREWYRYHHLFADLLHQRLQQTHPEKIPTLHRRASEWCEQNGFIDKAIKHSLGAGDFELAADLVESAWIPMNTNYQSVTWLGWARSLPEELIRLRPMLSAACGWASLDTGDLDSAELRFRDAERWLNDSEVVNDKNETLVYKPVVLGEEELRSLATSIANGRAYLAQALGDVNGTVKYAHRASDLLHDDDYFERGLSDVLLAFAYWANGELGAAHKAVEDAISNMRLTGKIPFVISFISYLADIMTAQGRLREAERTYLQLLEFTAEQDGSELKETSVLHLGLSEIYLEQGKLGAARTHLQRGEEFGEQPDFPPWYRHWIFAHYRLMQVQGNLDGMIKMLSEADRLYYRHPIPDVHPLKALVARTMLAQGRLDEVQDWVRAQGLTIDDDLSFMREFEHITLARLLIAQYGKFRIDGYLHNAMRLLVRILNAARDGGRTGSMIELLVLQALAYEAQNNTSSALISLRRALTLAEPECYVRTFVSEGIPMETLLKRMKFEDRRMMEYIDKLRAFFEEKKYPTLPPAGQSLIEPLSERELEILQLIADGLTNQEIGSQLFLSLNTVKAHTRNIYGKLGVNSRTQAAAKARALGILSPSQ